MRQSERFAGPNPWGRVLMSATVEIQPRADLPSYNQAYETIVDSDDDIIGLFAYALYKQHKRDWLISHKSENGSEPNAAEKAAFMRSQLLDKTVQSYRRRANDILSDYTNQVVEEAKPEHFKEALTERIENALGYWRGVWSGMGAAFFYTLALIALSVIIQISGIDLLEVYRKIAGL